MRRRSVSVRSACAADAPAIASVHHEAVLLGYRGIFPADSPKPCVDELVAEWCAVLTDPVVATLVAERDGALVGSLVIGRDPDEVRCGQLRRLHVLPRDWGGGIGGRLHDEALRLMARRGFHAAGLWVLAGNERARLMYEKRGWTLVAGDRRSPYNPTVAEVRYRRVLRDRDPPRAVGPG